MSDKILEIQKITKGNDQMITLTLTHEAKCWVGTTPEITFTGNTVLNGVLYPIIGNTRQEVIERIISELESRGRVHGILKVHGAARRRR